MATPNDRRGPISARAQAGFAKSAAYDEHRPRYPSDSVQNLLEQSRVAGVNGARVIDLAAGTGIFTEALAHRPEKFEITAIEPHDGMRQVLANKELPGVTVLGGKADRMPVEDESVDAVFVAQGFHWFANMESLRELHRVLQPHGVLALLWNIEDYNAAKDHKAATEWESKVHALTWTFDDAEPRYRHEQWRKVFDEQIKSTPMSILIAADPLFALPLGEHEERWTVWLPKDKIWERYNTISHIAVLEGEERERTHQAFADAINAPDVEVNQNGEVAIHGGTIAVWASKVPAEGREQLAGVEGSGT